MLDVYENKQAAGDANGQADNIDQRIISMLKKISQNDLQIIPEHGHSPVNRIH